MNEAAGKIFVAAGRSRHDGSSSRLPATGGRTGGSRGATRLPRAAHGRIDAAQEMALRNASLEVEEIKQLAPIDGLPTHRPGRVKRKSIKCAHRLLQVRHAREQSVPGRL